MLHSFLEWELVWIRYIGKTSYPRIIMILLNDKNNIYTPNVVGIFYLRESKGIGKVIPM